MQDIVLVFAACAVPVHSWSTFTFFNQMPGWLVYLNAWDLIGTFAYTQIFALLESVTILLVVILLGVILPARFLRDRFAAQGSTVVLLTFGWAIVAHSTQIVPFARSAPWLSKKLLFMVGLYLASIGVPYVLIYRYRRLEEFIYSFLERLTVLLYMYVPIACLGTVVVILRNI